MEFNPSTDQEVALNKISKWLDDPNRNSLLTFGGLAGSGKSTLISHIVKQFENKLRFAFCALSGKASSVLRTKLSILDIDPLYCGTIHRLIYKPIMDGNGLVVRWEKKSNLDFDIIVIDEASMVSEDIYKDLACYGIPILAVGDHNQLPPINGNFNLMGKPKIKLDKIHRQAEGNPIIQLASFVKDNGFIDKKSIPSDGVISLIKEEESIDYVYDLYSKLDNKKMFDYGVICYTNKIRSNFNIVIRRCRFPGTDDNPRKDDVIICLKNNSDFEIFNGYRGQILSNVMNSGKNHLRFRAYFQDDDRDTFLPNVNKHQFLEPNVVKGFNDFFKYEFFPKSWNDVGLLFDYGYAFTCHRFQGSQLNNLILYSPIPTMIDRETKRRWLYTAITRAVETIKIIV